MRERGVAFNDAVIELTEEEVANCYGLDQWALTGFTDYVIYSADKPN